MKKLLFVLLLLVSSQTGCSMWNTSLKSTNTQNVQTASDENTLDESATFDDGATDDDSWSGVGKEGRGRKTLSRNPENISWVDKYFVTEKTRQIERNLGVY